MVDGAKPAWRSQALGECRASGTHTHRTRRVSGTTIPAGFLTAAPKPGGANPAWRSQALLVKPSTRRTTTGLSERWEHEVAGRSEVPRGEELHRDDSDWWIFGAMPPQDSCEAPSSDGLGAAGYWQATCGEQNTAAPSSLVVLVTLKTTQFVKTSKFREGTDSSMRVQLRPIPVIGLLSCVSSTPRRGFPLSFLIDFCGGELYGGALAGKPFLEEPPQQYNDFLYLKLNKKITDHATCLRPQGDLRRVSAQGL